MCCGFFKKIYIRVKNEVGFWFLLDRKVNELSEYVRVVHPTKEEIYLLKYPSIKLVVLDHEENFPLPRFALGVADITSSLRDFAIYKVDICYANR